MTLSHRFFVHGIPEQQGSVKAFVVKGRPIITSANKNLAQWRDLIAVAAQEHAEIHTQAISIALTFYMPKPKSAPKKYIPMTKRPDLDKLIRSVLDALTGVFFKDDSQVDAIRASKVYANDTEPIGVSIQIRAEPEPKKKVETLNAEGGTTYL